MVRFFENTIQPIGGWARLQNTDAPPANLTALTGRPRAVRSWRSDDGQVYTAVGTVSTSAGSSKLYVITGMFGFPTQATSFDETVSGGLAAGKVDAGTGGNAGMFGNGFFGYGFFGQGQPGGTWTDADTWQLDTFGSYLCAVSTINQKLYVWAASTGTASAEPVWGLTSTGSVVTSGATAGSASQILITATTLTGTILAGERFTISGTTYTATSNATAAANIVTVPVTPTVPVAGIAATTAVTEYDSQPPLCHALVVTPERFLVALGADSNVRNVWWCDQESTTQWGELSTNAAGQYELKTDGRILFGAKTRNQTLVMTDVDLWVMTYIGGTFIYRFDQAGTNCGAISANAGCSSDTRYFWMGSNNFFVYDGFVKALPCDVADYVFGRMNQSQKSKVWSMARPQFGEIWWFYPSESSLEPNSYVVFNEREGHWTIGEMSANFPSVTPFTAGFENGATQFPILCDSTGAVWEHETGTYRGNLTTYPVFIESGPIEVGQGDRIIQLQGLYPDVSPVGASALWLTTYRSFNAMEDDTTAANTMVMGAALESSPTSFRVTGRQIRLKFAEGNATDWRLGTVRGAVQLRGTR